MAVLTLLVLEPHPDEPVVLPGRGKEGSVVREGEVGHRVGRPRLPKARPVGRCGGGGRGPDVKARPPVRRRGVESESRVVAPELNLLAGRDEPVAVVVPRERGDALVGLEASGLHPPIVETLKRTLQN